MQKVMMMTGVILVGLVMSSFFFFQKKEQSFRSERSKEVMCTKEAKLCPDGSAVERSGPNCEFTSCPTTAPSTDDIIITAPRPDELARTPLTILGKARGQWYFEGQFSVAVVASDGTVLGKGTAQAVGDWMTSEWVPFEAIVEFVVPHAGIGSVLFMKENPSGFPEREKTISVPLRF
ncbi:MAG: hypothetical protein HYV45_03095 [Candidatus Moranbacteria bacterium]|nr:hypothetical protein [Candidatus Moranbacteria bacterium]